MGLFWWARCLFVLKVVTDQSCNSKHSEAGFGNGCECMMTLYDDFKKDLWGGPYRALGIYSKGCEQSFHVIMENYLRLNVVLLQYCMIQLTI